MSPATRDVLEKAGFGLSAALLVFLAGYVVRDRGWFPHGLLQRALGQGERVVSTTTSPPDFTNRRSGGGGPGRGDAGPARPGGERGTGVTSDRDAAGPALTLITSSWPDFDWDPGLKLIDRRGEVLHEWRVEPTELFSEEDHRRGADLSEQDLQGTVLLPNGDVVANVEYAGTVRLDACSRVKWTLSEGSHHSVERDADGSFWIPGVSHEREARSERYPDGYPGLDGRIYHSVILHVSADGEVLREISVLDLLYDNGLERFLPKTDQHDQRDVVHLNDVEPLPPAMAGEYPLFEAGDLVASLRNLDMVLVFDPDSRRVKWSAMRPFIFQHDPDWIGGGWIGVFDNNWDDTERGTMLGGSRIVALQPHTDSTRVLFPTGESEHVYTAHRGKWQLLADGNLLLAEADQGRVLEVAPDGRTVWEWQAEPYDGSTVPSVTRAARVDLTREEVAAWPCSPGEKSGRGG